MITLTSKNNASVQKDQSESNVISSGTCGPVGCGNVISVKIRSIEFTKKGEKLR